MTDQERAFINRIGPMAQASQRQYGVPASVTIAQAILESSNKSGWGQSRLALEANNYFGIKHREGVDEPYVDFRTHEFFNKQDQIVMAHFRSFDSPEASFNAHAALLAGLPRYAKAMRDKNDPGLFSEQLQDCGYSTDPEYAGRLKFLIGEYHLYEWDAAAPESPDPPATQANV